MAKAAAHQYSLEPNDLLLGLPYLGEHPALERLPSPNGTNVRLTRSLLFNRRSPESNLICHMP